MDEEFQFDVGEMVRDLAEQLSNKCVENAQLRAIIKKLSENASAPSESSEDE